MENGLERGKYGYIDYKKKRLLLLCLIFAACVVFFVVLGLIIFNTLKNYLMIPGMLMVLPFANFAASFAALFKFKTADIEKYGMLKHFADNDMLLCDLAVVNDAGKRYYAEFAVVYKNGILMYGSDTRWKTQDMDTFFNAKLRGRGLNIRLKSYHDWNEFLRRVDGLEPAEDETMQRRMELARETVINSCM